MANTQKLLPITQLIQIARDGPAQGLSQQSYQSIPFPCQNQRDTLIAFMYCGCKPSPQGRLLLPPGHMAWIDASKGCLQELRVVTPGDFSRQDDPNQFLGIYAGPEHIPQGEIKSYTERFYNAYDNLLALYFTGQAANKAGNNTKEFRRLFGLLAEPVLEPYYQSTGKMFFDWLGN
ncbi:MAG: hypothetical protein GXP08_02040 [Gammaproteobacteria bacterium]|nr:hypothetical protein [Gammaproteobacteria bacterium]